METIGCVLKGPAKFTKKQIAAAEAKVAAIVEAAKQAEQAFKDEHPIDKEYVPYVKRLEKMLDYEQYDSFEDAEDIIGLMANMEPKKFVEEFTEWWRTGYARDTCSRPDPDDKKSILLFCGESSNGNSPDGEGWNHVRHAEWFDLFRVLNIR
jgi:hypothetical protein